MEARLLVLVLLGLGLGAQAQIFITVANTTCGGTGGNCATAGFLNASNPNVCTDGAWPGYSCVSPLICARVSTLIWRCLQLTPPSPPLPNIPPMPPAQASPPPAVCTSPVAGLSGLIDPNTPSTACTQQVKNGPCAATSGTTPTNMVLVFSDEFSDLSRDMSAAARHRTWTAANQWWDQDQDQAAYKPDAVTTRACDATNGETCSSPGVLSIRLTNTPVTDTFSPQATGPVAAGSKAFKSGMLSSWNKFCFTGGYMEANIKMPSNLQVGGGLWPGLWLMGNLGRPGFYNSTNGMWPYSFNTCTTANPSWNQAFDNKMGLINNQCAVSGSSTPYDLKSGTARSVPQINIVRSKVVPPTGTASGHPTTYTTSGLLMAPLLPSGYSYNDPTRLVGQCVDNSVFGATYTNNQCLRSRDGTSSGGPGLCTCPATPGGIESSCWAGQTSTVSRTGNLDADQLSASLTVDATVFSGFRKYGVWWKPATSTTAGDGFIRFYIDGNPFYEVNDAALAAIIVNTATITPQRNIPYEPMQIVMNLAVSSFWGGVDPSLSTNLPAELLVDYIRLYQEQSLASTATLSCSPPNLPTAQYIACNPLSFVLCNASAPLASCTDYQVLREKVGSCQYTNAAPRSPPPPPPTPPAPSPTVTLLNIGQQCGGNQGGCLPSSRPQGQQYYGVCKDSAAWDSWSCGSQATCLAGRDDTPQLMYCKQNQLAVTSVIRLNIGAPTGAADVTVRGGSVFSSSWQSSLTPSTVATNSTTGIVAGTSVTSAVNDVTLWGTWVEANSFSVTIANTSSNMIGGTQYLATLMFVEPWWTAAGQRVFAVTFNGQSVYTALDLVVDCGGPLIACTKRFVFTAPANGAMVFGFAATATSKAGAVLSGIEIVRYTSPPASPRPPRPPPPPPPATPPSPPISPPAPSPPSKLNQPPTIPSLLSYTATYLIGSTLTATDPTVTNLLTLLAPGSTATISGYTASFNLGLRATGCPADTTSYRTSVATQLGIDVSSVTAGCAIANFPPSPPPPSPPMSPPPPTIIPISGRKLRATTLNHQLPTVISQLPTPSSLHWARRSLGQAITAIAAGPFSWASQLKTATESAYEAMTGGSRRRKLQASNVIVYYTTAAVMNSNQVVTAPGIMCAFFNSSVCVTSVTSTVGSMLGTQLTIVSYATSTAGMTSATACEATGSAIAAALATIYPSGSPTLINAPVCNPFLPPSPPIPASFGDLSAPADSGDGGVNGKTVGLAIGISVGGVLVIIAIVMLLRWAFKREDEPVLKDPMEIKPMNTPQELQALQNAALGPSGAPANVVRTANFIPKTRATGDVAMEAQKPSLMTKMFGAMSITSKSNTSNPAARGLNPANFASPNDDMRRGEGGITSIMPHARGMRGQGDGVIRGTSTALGGEKSVTASAWSSFMSRASSVMTTATAGSFATTAQGTASKAAASGPSRMAAGPPKISRAGDPLLAPPEPKAKSAVVVAQKLVPQSGARGKLDMSTTTRPTTAATTTDKSRPASSMPADDNKQHAQ